MKRIYEDAFPAREREDFDATQQDGRLLLQVTASSGASVVGFAQVIAVPGAAWCLLEYMAVTQEHRSLGIGTRLLGAVVHALDERGHAGILLEVEDPAFASDTAAACRRIDFYERNGASPVAGITRYFIPDFTNPRQRVPMKLMAIPLRGRVPVHRDELATLLSAMYEAAFGPEASSLHLPEILAEIKAVR